MPVWFHAPYGTARDHQEYAILEALSATSRPHRRVFLVMHWAIEC